ncbi:MAG: hypothetical protein ACD_28C00243G0001, partial [uncultured bacterium]
EFVQQGIQALLQQVNVLSRRVDERLKENSLLTDRTHRTLGDRLDHANKVINQVTHKLASLEESNQRIFEVGKDILSLQEILKTPKLRGNLGELFLGDLLTQILPRENFSLQHKFKTGAVVDAVIRLREGLLVPVDAKFPLENFKRGLHLSDEKERMALKKTFFNDVQKHVDAIADRYILTDEGTLDFALMYVPAENIYYDMIIRENDEKNISEYALSRRVIPVSPNSFYVYLQALLLGLRGLQIEKEAKGILLTLGRLKGDFQKFGEEFSLLGTHLGRAQNTYGASEKRLNQFRGKLEILDTSEVASPELPANR